MNPRSRRQHLTSQFQALTGIRKDERAQDLRGGSLVMPGDQEADFGTRFRDGAPGPDDKEILQTSTKPLKVFAPDPYRSGRNLLLLELSGNGVFGGAGKVLLRPGQEVRGADGKKLTTTIRNR